MLESAPHYRDDRRMPKKVRFLSLSFPKKNPPTGLVIIFPQHFIFSLKRATPSFIDNTSF
jgi:hypothetical protein